MRTCMLVLLAGCLVGPDYRVPSAPVPASASYREARSAGHWKIARPSDAMLRGKWWEVFREPELNVLEERLNVNNQTIAQFFEQYMAARAQIREARAGYFPTVTTNPIATASRGIGGAGFGSGTSSSTTINAGGGNTFHNYSLPLEASWAPDLFGRVRYAVRQATYGAQVSAADLENQRLLAQATLAQTFFQLRGQDAMQDMLDGTVVADRAIFNIARTRSETGVDTEVAAVQAAQTLQGAIVQATNNGILRAQYEHAIATLLGVAATGFAMPKRAHLAVPPEIPTGTPSQLLERRPDIAAAERAMARDNAQIGLGYTAYFPTLTLTGSAGFASTAIDTLLSWPSRVWSIGASLSETLFDAGLRRATIDQFVATYNADVAVYRQTVLTAFQQVEDALSQSRILAQEIEQQRTLVAQAQRALDLITVRYQTGVDPYLNLETQQTILLGAKQALIQLQVQEMTAVVALVEALGGGWQKSDLPR